MILKIVLTILGWLKENLLAVAALTVGGISLGVTVWVATRIYQIQKRESEEVRKKQEESLAEMVLLILSEVTGRPVPPEVAKRVKRLAKGIIDRVIQVPMLRAAATAITPDSVTAKVIKKEPGSSANPEPEASERE